MPYNFRNYLSCHGVKSILSNCIPQSLQVVLIWYKINNRFHPVLSDQHKDILIAIILSSSAIRVLTQMKVIVVLLEPLYQC